VGRWLRTLANGFEICATVPAAGSEISLMHGQDPGLTFPDPENYLVHT